MKIASKPYSLKQRSQSLNVRHLTLEQRIDEELKRPLPDSLLLQRLKRQRLAAKEEMDSINSILRTLDVGRLTPAA